VTVAVAPKKKASGGARGKSKKPPAKDAPWRVVRCGSRP
jgi:hypothetical protein